MTDYRTATPSWLRTAAPTLLILAVAFAVRGPVFGDPAIQVDEQFYLLVGERMLHAGALPFVTIWDRKPIGLFLLYAGLRAIGGLGILPYQIAATLSVAATALLLRRLARMIARDGAATAAAILYILLLSIFGGVGGQAPVFYNLPVAAAALLVATLVGAEGETQSALPTRGSLAMLLMGLAIQIKYTVLFEGMFLGLALLYLGWRQRWSVPRLLTAALLWVALALLPTALAIGAYAALGHLHEFWFANFQSIFARRSDAGGATAGRLLTMLAFVAPLLPAFAGRWIAAAPATAVSASRRDFVVGWAAAACLGVLLFGSYFDHYALPLCGPLAVANAPLFDARRFGRWWAGLLLLAALVAGTINVRRDVHKRGGWSSVGPIAATIGSHPPGCLYIYDGDPILYHLTGSCLLTRWPFPAHLANIREASALGIDVVAETGRILAQRPAWIVTMRGPDGRLTNPATARLVDRALALHYRRLLSEPVGQRREELYRRVS